MTKGEAINWIINLRADIGKIEHQDLWHYEQTLAEIIELLEEKPERRRRLEFIGDQIFRCHECGHTFTQKLLEGWKTSLKEQLYLPPCPNCGARMDGEIE